MNTQTLKRILERLKKVSGIELSLFAKDGSLMVSTLEEKDADTTNLVQLFKDSGKDYKDVGIRHFFSVYSQDELCYILVARGTENAAMIGQIAVDRLGDMLEAEDDDYNKNGFYQNLLMDSLLRVDIYNKAKKLHIEVDIPRVVFVVEVQAEQDTVARQFMKGLYGGQRGDFITAVDEKHIILIRSLTRKETYEDLEEEAKVMADMLNTEAMINVRVSYGTIVKDLRETARSYKEAVMALDVGQIFFAEKNIISYNSLGIGRLIYQLPIGLCEMFINEVFGEITPDDIDEETMANVLKFYECNLNISETARALFIHRNTLVYRLERLRDYIGLDIRIFEDAMTFKLALLVYNYVQYIKEKNE